MITYDIPTMKSPGDAVQHHDLEPAGRVPRRASSPRRRRRPGTIGVVISASDTNWFEMEGGYIAGARSVNPKIKITSAQIGTAVL